MNILFLDVDGVLNNAELLDWAGKHALGDEQLALLQKIIASTGAKIVLTSTWRLHEDALAILKSILARFSLEIFDKTTLLIPRKLSMSVYRCEEIEEWLDRHTVEKFAILDDKSHAGFDMEENFFKTDFEIGLTNEIAESIIQHLKEKHEPAPRYS